MQHTLFVCVLCRAAKENSTDASTGEALFQQLAQELEACEWRDTIDLRPVRCMGACSRSCVVAFAAPAKLTFILSELSPVDAAQLRQFSGQYIACTDGKVPYRERPDAVKRGIHAVLPPLLQPQPSLNNDHS